MLDTAVLLGAVPDCYRELGLDELDTYFAMARGYQGEKGDVPALAMKKWFNTNYHYIEPELGADTKLSLSGTKPFEEYEEAKQNGISTKPVVVGPFTFLKLARYQNQKTENDFVEDICKAYVEILTKFDEKGAEWIQLDEPALVRDLTKADISLFETLYQTILDYKGKLKVLLQTYFGDVRDCYQNLIQLDFDGIGLDFLEGRKSAELIENYGFPKDKILFAGIVNGKNIWKCDYENVLKGLENLKKYAKKIVLSTSCSLLHVPYTLENEKNLGEAIRQHFAFAFEKLGERNELTVLAESKDYKQEKSYVANQQIVKSERCYQDENVRETVKKLPEHIFTRTPERKEREKIQKEVFGLPLFPTTTIGSFPQTQEVKRNRSRYKKGEIDKASYDKQNFAFIKECIEKQESMGIDVLVHGEYERNDMVEFFGENLEGYVFTEKAWVQSYGTRCVKPPIIFGDIKRTQPITVAYSAYAQGLTKKPVKGMLTGPVTILNWSFPREDVTLKEMAYQIGIAIREEVLDLEKAGIRMIQIDEAALKEKLPIRKSDWYSEYLEWAIPAFRLCHSEVGPGVYDIHSPRVPSVEEIVEAVQIMLTKVDKEKLWINPDCGLKTRGITETDASLKNLVAAAEIVRTKSEGL